MRKHNLYASVSVVALSLGVTSVAFADPDITGSATNNESVSIDGGAAITGLGNIGVTASSSINATGASAVVSGLSAGADFSGIGKDDGNDGVTSSVGNITLEGTNTETVNVNAGANISFVDGNKAVENGGSASISGLGASTGISFTGVTGTATVPTLATDTGEEIKMTSTNNEGVTVTDTKIQAAAGTVEEGPDVSGDAAGLSINATGAASSVNLRAVDMDSFTTSGDGIGNITTNKAANTEAVTVTGSKIISGDVSGVGSSVSVGSTAAVASVSTTSVNSDAFQTKIGTISQDASNSKVSFNEDTEITTGPLGGTGASVSASATGSAVSVSEAFVANNGNTASTFGNITQNATTTSDASSRLRGASVTTTTDLTGIGASARLSASGASASVGSSALSSGGVNLATFGTTDQTVENKGSVNVGEAGEADSDNTLTVGTLDKSGTSAGIGAVGASGAVSSSTLNSGSVDGATFGATTQTVKNTGGTILNEGSTLETGEVKGAGSSSSISATGATGAVAGSAIEGGVATSTSFAAVDTTVANTGNVTLKGATLDSSAGVSGTAASAGLSVGGASASASSVNLSAGGAAAANFDTVKQTVDNSGVIALTATGVESLKSGEVSGTAASAQMSASGAVGSVSASTIEGGHATGATIGNVTQTITNDATGTVTVTGFEDTGNKTDVLAGDLSGIGASAGISALGAGASVNSSVIGTTAAAGGASFTGTVGSTAENKAALNVTDTKVATGAITGVATSASIGAVGASASAGASVIDRQEAVTTATFTGLVTQDADNTGGTVTVTGNNVTGGGGLDAAATGSSLGVSAVGATASASSTIIGGDGDKAAAGATFTGGVTQSATNTGNIDNKTSSVDAGGAIAALGGSASIGAVGATASAGATVIETSSTGATFTGAITQTVDNTGGNVTTTGTAATADVVVSNLAGIASSAGMSAMGAAASVNSTMLKASGSGSSFAGGATQTVTNTGAVGVTVASVTPGAISGTAASANLTAMGASASVGASMIGSEGTALAGGGDFAQDVESKTGGVSVADSGITVTGITGTGASAGIGATGVSASVSANYIDSSDKVTTGATFGNITQGTDVGTRGVNNLSAVDVSEVALSVDALDGPAASASISGTGASAGVSVASIADTKDIAGSTFGTVGQFVQNQAAGAVNVGTVDGEPVTLTVTGLGGNADSASISARGASASVGVTEIAGTGTVMASSEFGAITQDVINSGAITIGDVASIASTNGLTGIGSSASIAASGASASFSVAGIDNAAAMAPVQVASISQTALNSAAVSNNGSMSLGGGALGTAASASISATGASTGVSFTAIKTPGN